MKDLDIHWPALLQRYSVTPTRVRLRPQQAMGGSIMLIIVALVSAAAAIFAAIGEHYPVALLYVLPFATLFLAIPISDRYRWCEIERTADGWRFAGGIGRRCRWSREVNANEIITTCIGSEPGYSFGLHAWWSDYLRVELSTLPFSGRPKPIEIGRHLVIPRAELEALGALLEGKTVT